MSIASPSTCPKCQAHVAPGFDSCPQCGVIFAKLRHRPTGDTYSGATLYGGPSPASSGAVAASTAPSPNLEIWKAFGLAAVAAILGFLTYQELDTLEQQGGSVRMNTLVILLYKTTGTTGIAVVFGAAALYFLVSGIRQLASR